MRTLAIPPLILCVATISLPAQWLHQPTTGIPRTPDGKPNLSAPAPKTFDGKPDLSGLWRLGVAVGVSANITGDLPPADIRPWVAALSLQRLQSFGKDDPKPSTACPAARGTSPTPAWRKSSRPRRSS